MKHKIEKLGFQKRMLWLANVIFAVIMAVIVFCALFGPSSEIAKNNFFAELIVALGILAGGIFAYRKFLPKIEKWSKRRMLILELIWFALIVGIVVYFSHKLKIASYTWDPMYLRYGIDELLAGRNLDHFYFNWYPYQRSLVYFIYPIVKFTRVIGLSINTSDILVMVNIVAIIVTVVFAYLALRTWLGRARALFWLFVSPIILLPLLLYAPICYTDTMSAVFVALSFFLLMKLYRGCKHPRIMALLFGLSCFFGMQIKATAAILMIAAAIVLILKTKYEMIPKYIAPLTIAILAFVPLTLAWNNFRNKPEHPESVVPMTHFVAMGLKDDGGFNGEDADEAAHVIAEGGDIKEFEMNKIKQRLSDYGVGGYAAFAMRKISYVWGDGEYYAWNKLSRNPVNTGSTISKLAYGEHREILSFVTGAVHLAIMLLFAYVGWRSLKDFDSMTMVLKMCLCGVFLFFLVWEARSRYLLNYLPLFSVLAFAFLQKLEPKVKIHRYRTTKKK